MSRQPASTAQPWLLRWLLVVATLAGLGIWQGGHCADDMSPEPAGRRTVAATAVIGDTAAPQIAAAADRHDERQSPSRHDQPGTTADPCQDLTAAVACAAFTAALPQPDGIRTAIAAPRGPAVKQRPISAVILAHIGVSRT
ncbi:hypothetical protein [Actinoplanes sp. NPDC049316]|uniref:hypothetical protein n=1 Tax=Actinoplanes sp. NPDC049316 TaxID=3154727 RepID=UPI003422BDEC